MALDLKVELFAYDLFQQLFHAHGFLPEMTVVSVKYEEECNGDPDYEEVYDPVHMNAVRCREYLFRQVFIKEVRIFDELLSSQMDFYQCFLSFCQDTNLFVDLTIFERVFATCAFLYQMCLVRHRYAFKDCVEFAYLCWAMYFDKYSTEFYNQGGWQQLKRVASSYIFPWHFLSVHGRYETSDSVLINKMSSSVQNHSRFIKSTEIFSRTCAKNWINFRVRNRNKTDGSAFDRSEVNISCKEELEELLRDIRLCCYSCVLGTQPAKLTPQLNPELPWENNFNFPTAPAANENDIPSSEMRCSDRNNSTDAQIHASSIQNVEEAPSRIPVNKSTLHPMDVGQQDMTLEPESLSGTGDKPGGSLSDLSVLAEDVEPKQNALPAEKGTSSSGSHNDIVTKYQSTSAVLDFESLSSTETLDVHITSCARQSLNLGDENICHITEGILETSTLELSPCSIRKKKTSLDDETRKSQSQQQEDKKIQILADLTLDEKEMFPGIDRIKCNDSLDPTALFREIAKSFDKDLATPEQSSQLQPKSSPTNRFVGNDSILEECLKNIIDEEDCEKNCKQLGDDCTEATMEDLSGCKMSESKADTISVWQSASTLQGVVSSKTDVAKKKKKRKNAKSKKRNPQMEQESEDVIDLLRMFLVLGDKVGIRHVCSTLQTPIRQSKN